MGKAGIERGGSRSGEAKRAPSIGQRTLASFGEHFWRLLIRRTNRIAVPGALTSAGSTRAGQRPTLEQEGEENKNALIGRLARLARLCSANFVHQTSPATGVENERKKKRKENQTRAHDAGY